MEIKDLCKEAHRIAVDHGFWDCPRCKGNKYVTARNVHPFEDQTCTVTCHICGGTGKAERNDGEMIALMHSELSEVLEALRHGNTQSEKIPEFTQEEEEYADLLIRVADTAQKKSLRLEEAILAKMKYNESRPYRHGKKF